MRAIKLVLFAVLTTIIMCVSWAAGTAIGNALTHSTPPPTANAAETGAIFLAVCLFNSILIALLLGTTSSFSGIRRRLALILYVFTIQSLLPQMETFFFGQQMGIGYDQAAAILIAGVIVSFVTVWIATWLYKKLITPPALYSDLVIPNLVNKDFVISSAPLIIVGYPFLYLTFGYFIAWQSDRVRMYYTGSAEMASYAHQLKEVFSNGIYFFQIIRGATWIIVTIPIATMLRERKTAQYLVVGILSALMPTSLLFIPNPYMPADVAMVHFVETSLSNLLWGITMVLAINHGLRRQIPDSPPR